MRESGRAGVTSRGPHHASPAGAQIPAPYVCDLATGLGGADKPFVASSSAHREHSGAGESAVCRARRRAGARPKTDRKIRGTRWAITE